MLSRKRKIFKNKVEKSFLLLLEYLRSSENPIFNDLIEENIFYVELNFWKHNKGNFNTQKFA